MEVWAPSPSPIALFLLGLEERGAEGSVEVGERTVVLRRGRVVDVRRAEGDPSLHEFLRATGRISEAETLALRAIAPDPDRLPEGSTLLSPDALHESLRALWLDRLVRGMAVSETQGRAVPPLKPEAMPHSAPHAGFDAALVPLVLDALSRRAQEGDAEQVGLRAQQVLEWLEGPHTARAKKWAQIEQADRIAQLLLSSPAAASRIAALVRAGIARIVPPGASVPAPARRLPTMPAPAMTEGRLSMMSLAPPRPAEVQLSPGAARAFAEAGDLRAPIPELPPPTATLEDPLDPIEREIAALEESGAPSEQRAEVWSRAAGVWRDRYGSVDEQERALREAAAAAPNDPATLLVAADGCAANGRTDLALAYGRAAVAASSEGPARDDVLLAYASLARRIGKASAAMSALRAAFQGPRADTAHAIAGAMLLDQGRRGDAADELLEAAMLAAEADPARASHLVLAAYWAAPERERAREALFGSLASSGRALGAIALRADLARRTTDADAARTLLLGAAERAELEERPLLAAELLARALDAEPDLDVVYEPLDVDLANAGALVERAVLLEEIAAGSLPESRGHWLSRAADARLEIPGDGAWELELRIRCLEHEPEDAAAMDAVRKHAEASSDPMVLADALERAARATGWTDATLRRAALEELGIVAEQQTNEPLRAAWARSVAAALGGEPMSKARARFEPATRPLMARAAELERISRQGTPEERPIAIRDLARILAQDPERRDRAVALLGESLATTWDDPSAEILERIHALRGEIDAQVAVLEARAEKEPKRIEKVRRLMRIAALHAARGMDRESAGACLRALDLVPGHREAIVRLRRAGARLRAQTGEDRLLRDALAREGRLQLPPPERARALTSVAIAAEIAGDAKGTREAAIAAIESDPDAAEAAWILTRALGAAGATAPTAVIARARALVGDAPPLLAAAIRSAESDVERVANVEAWSLLAPGSAEPWRVALEASRKEGSHDQAIAVCEAIARHDPAAHFAIDPSLAAPIAAALEEAADAGLAERATEAAIACADRLGPEGQGLRDLAARLAPRTASDPLRVAALERGLAGAAPEDTTAKLRAIAAQHGKHADLAGEARALLRVLARAPRDRDAVERLAWIYASTGEHQRLMAVLALRIGEGAAEGERLDGWIALAAASARFVGDREAALAFARSALEGTPPAENDEHIQRVMRVAGALVSADAADEAIALVREEAARTGGTAAGRLAERAAAIAAREKGDVRHALDLAIEGLLAAPGYGPLLVAFEQLALELGDVPLAVRTYGELHDRAMGASGRRAILYRRARWLERAKADREALDAYLDAAKHSASPGAILTAIDRLARATGDLEAMARGRQALAENAQHPLIRLGLLRRAAELLDQEVGRPERSWEILFPLWKEMGLSELEEDLGRLGARIQELDPGGAQRAFGELFGELQRRADEAWMADEKARLVMKQARLHAIALGDLARAEAMALEALAALRSEDPEPAKEAEILSELATWLRRDPARAEDARARAREALEREPTSEAARKVAQEFGIEVPPAAAFDESGAEGGHEAVSEAVSEAGAGAMGGAGSSGREPVVAGAVETETASGGAIAGVAAVVHVEAVEVAAGGDDRAAPATESATANGHAGTAPGAFANGAGAEHAAADHAAEDARTRTGTSAPRLAVALPDDDDELAEPERPSRMDVWVPARAPQASPASSSGAPPIAMPIGDDEPEPQLADGADALEVRARMLFDAGDASASAMARAALVIEPGRLEAIQILHEAARTPVESVLASAVLAVVDPARQAPPPLRIDPAWAARARDTILRNPAHATARRLLALVWESALPLFRVTIQQLGVLGTDRVGAHSATPIARALAAVSETTEGDEPIVFATRRPGVGVVPVRTHPPAVLTGASMPTDDGALRFLLARAIELARPEHVLVATLDEADGRNLVAALRAAFGPAEGAQVAREAAALAAQLWRTIPTRTQRDVRELLVECDDTFDYDALRASILGGAARAGLIASGDLAASIRALASEDAALARVRLEGAGLADAVARSSALADLLRFAFGDALVEASRVA